MINFVLNEHYNQEGVKMAVDTGRIFKIKSKKNNLFFQRFFFENQEKIDFESGKGTETGKAMNFMAQMIDMGFGQR